MADGTEDVIKVLPPRASDCKFHLAAETLLPVSIASVLQSAPLLSASSHRWCSCAAADSDTSGNLHAADPHAPNSGSTGTGAGSAPWNEVQIGYPHRHSLKSKLQPDQVFFANNSERLRMVVSSGRIVTVWSPADETGGTGGFELFREIELPEEDAAVSDCVVSGDSAMLIVETKSWFHVYRGLGLEENSDSTTSPTRLLPAKSLPRAPTERATFLASSHWFVMFNDGGPTMTFRHFATKDSKPVLSEGKDEYTTGSSQSTTIATSCRSC
jgi:hypothetical protein